MVEYKGMAAKKDMIVTCGIYDDSYTFICIIGVFCEASFRSDNNQLSTVDPLRVL